jgi:hypothetical protein
MYRSMQCNSVDLEGFLLCCIWVPNSFFLHLVHALFKCGLNMSSMFHSAYWPCHKYLEYIDHSFMPHILFCSDGGVTC